MIKCKSGIFGLAWCIIFGVGLVLFMGVQAAKAAVYCNITDVETKQLTNGVQVTVKADGVLDWQPDREAGFRWGKADQIPIRFPGARSQLDKNFIDVSMYPVSYVQISVPQDVKQGIGVRMVVALFASCEYTITESTDRQSLIITVKSERTLEVKKEKAAEEEVKEKVKLEVEYKDGLVSVEAMKADIHKLLGRIAEETGVDIAVDDAVKHKVSMNLENMSVDEVLRGIASACGLALLKIDGIYMFSGGVPTDLSSYHLSGTDSFRMSNIRADTAAGLLPTFLFKYRNVNDEQNAVVVTAPTQMLDKVRKDLGKLDAVPPLIMIETLAVEFATTEDINIGLGLEYQSAHMQSSMDTQTGEITYSTVGALPRDFEARLKALVDEKKARIRARPRMAVVNGEWADIFIGAQKFIKVRYLQWGQYAEKIQAVDVGVTLRVNPWTGGNGEITTYIEPKVSNITELEPETGLPTLSTREASTTVRVKDGETIVIGGLWLKQEYEAKRKIPILGDIPLIGSLFRSKSKTTVNSELVIFITPYILTETGHLKDEEEEQKLKERFLNP